MAYIQNTFKNDYKWQYLEKNKYEIYNINFIFYIICNFWSFIRNIFQENSSKFKRVLWLILLAFYNCWIYCSNMAIYNKYNLKNIL